MSLEMKMRTRIHYGTVNEHVPQRRLYSAIRTNKVPADTVGASPVASWDTDKICQPQWPLPNGSPGAWPVPYRLVLETPKS
jgi:hypothetical protein